MFESLENLINEVLNEKPIFRDFVEKIYLLISETDKEALNNMIETPFNETLKEDILAVLNSKNAEALALNASAFLEKYPIAKDYKNDILASKEATELLNEFKGLILNENLQELAPIDNPLYNLFLQTYQEFKGVDFQTIAKMFVKISCIYPSYKDLIKQDKPDPCNAYPFFMLVAHYLCVEGKAELAGYNKSAGVVSSSSIDSVSVSYVTPPYKDNFQYFFSQTPYGQEYLAYISTNNVMMYINNAKNRM